MKRQHLGEFEETVLLWVYIQHEKAFGLSVTRAIEEEMERSITLSSVHTALYRLEEKSLVESKLGEPTPVRGGRRKRFFVITNAGKETLFQARQMRKKLWAMVPDNFLLDWEL